jgi:hypothetical protein
VYCSGTWACPRGPARGRLGPAGPVTRSPPPAILLARQRVASSGPPSQAPGTERHRYKSVLKSLWENANIAKSSALAVLAVANYSSNNLLRLSDIAKMWITTSRHCSGLKELRTPKRCHCNDHIGPYGFFLEIHRIFLHIPNPNKSTRTLNPKP